MATLSTFDGALKTKFIGPIRDQLYSNKILLEGMRTRDATKETNKPRGSKEFRGIPAMTEGIDYVGRTFNMALHSAGNSGVGYRAENAALPQAGAQGYKVISDGLRYIYGLFTLTGQVIRASDKSEGAFAKAMSEEMKRLTDDLKRRVSIGGYLAKDANGTAPAATVTSGAASATQAVSTTRYVRIGDTVDFYDPTGATYRGTAARTIVSINPTGLTITLDASVTTTTNDIMVFASPNSTSATPNNDKTQAPNGLANIVNSTGALHGLNPANAGEGFWQSYVKDAASAVVSDTLLRDVKDNIGMASGEDDAVVGIWTRGIRNRYVNTLTTLKQFTDDKSTTLRGGFKAVLFDETAMVVDDQCQNGTTYFINCDSLFWSQMSDFEWLQEDGKVLKWVPGFDAYTGVLFKYHNLGTSARNRHGKLINLQDDNR